MAEQLPSRFNGWAFLRLAFPMIVSRTGLAAMGIADAIMVSRFHAQQFACLSLAEGTLGRVLDVFVAFLIGGLSLVPRYFAQGKSAAALFIWKRTILVSIALGLIGTLVGFAGKNLLLLMGQQPELAAGAAPVMAILGVGYPAALLAIAAGVYLEGINRPRFVAISIVAANVLNIIFNWILIGGHLGFAALGARGSALSTTAVRCGLCAALVGVAWRFRPAESLPGQSYRSDDFNTSRKSQWRLGFGASGTVAAMVALTAPLTLFAGWLGVLSLASFSAAWNLAAPAGLLGLGMADAAGIYVAATAGRAGDRGAAAVAWSSLGMTLAPIAPLVCCLAVWASLFASIYTKNTALRTIMATLIPIVAAILFVDCGGFVMAASLRALREVAWPAAIEIGSMLLLIPLALHLAFREGFGVRGLFFAMLASALVRFAMLVWRFWRRTRFAAQQPIAPVTDWSLHAD